MSKTIAIIALLGALIIPASAVAKSKDYYSSNGRCRAGYVRHYVKTAKRKHGRIVRKHRKIVYVRRLECVVKSKAKAKTQTPVVNPPAATAQPTIQYSVKVDPSFTRSTSPLSVVYSYSADATETQDGVTKDLGAAGDLPLGILQLYSSFSLVPGAGESLVCSINVGDSTTGGTCPVNYLGIGSYRVTTDYIVSSTTSTTETDTETLTPFTTTSTISSQTSGSTTSYNDAIVDQNGNAVNAIPDHWIVTDTTTGQDVGDFYNAGNDVSFQIVTDYDPTTLQPDGQAVAIFEAGASTPRASGSWINPSDSFTVQAIYDAPGNNSAYDGSTAQAVPLAFSN